MTHSDVTPTIVLRPGYEPGVIGRIGELHGRYYAAAWGSGAAFEIQVLRALVRSSRSTIRGRTCC